MSNLSANLSFNFVYKCVEYKVDLFEKRNKERVFTKYYKIFV